MVQENFSIGAIYKRLVTLSTYRRYTNNCIYLSNITKNQDNPIKTVGRDS